MTLSFSQINAKKTCSMRWWLRYVARLAPTKKAVPLTIGTMGHALLHNALIVEHDLDLHFEDVGWPTDDGVDFSPDEYEAVSEFYENSKPIIDGVVDDFYGWKFLHLEVEVRTTTEEGHSYIGFVDAIAIDPDGFAWIIDWKFRKNFSSDEWNPQLALYRRLVMDTFGIDVQGVVIYEIKPAVPATPKLNKNKTMSRGACSTDWATYEQALLDNDLNPLDYDDMREKLKGRKFRKANHYFYSMEVANRVIDSAITPFAHQIAEDDTADLTIEEASKKHGLQLGWACKMCDFKPICVNIPYGLDSNEVTSLGFHKREKSSR